ncbi:MAG: TVP38/TMEM64 family protein [Candidatus Babeliales bacterium]
MNQRIKSIVATLLLVAVGAAFYYLKLGDYINISYVHSNMALLQTYIARNYMQSVICYMGAFIGATACAIPGSSIFTIAGGLLFGWPGLIYAVCAASIGSLLLFFACRYFIGSWVQHKYARHLAKFNKEISLHGHYYLLLVRLIAVLPFGLVTMLSGLTLISISMFLGATFLGLIPVSTAYVFVGRRLQHLASPEDLSQPFIFFIIFKIALAPAVFKIVKRAVRLIRPKKEQIKPVYKDEEILQQVPKQEKRYLIEDS